MERLVRAIRGATTIDEDTPEQITGRVTALVAEMLSRNSVSHDDLISVIFTATEDVGSMFPATAARTIGLGDVPLICAREISVAGATPMCIRVMAHAYSERDRSELHHVYLEGARGLRDDLPE